MGTSLVLTEYINRPTKRPFRFCLFTLPWESRGRISCLFSNGIGLHYQFRFLRQGLVPSVEAMLQKNYVPLLVYVEPFNCGPDLASSKVFLAVVSC